MILQNLFESPWKHPSYSFLRELCTALGFAEPRLHYHEMYLDDDEAYSKGWDHDASKDIEIALKMLRATNTKEQMQSLWESLNVLQHLRSQEEHLHKKFKDMMDGPLSEIKGMREMESALSSIDQNQRRVVDSGKNIYMIVQLLLSVRLYAQGEHWEQKKEDSTPEETSKAKFRGAISRAALKKLGIPLELS